LENFVPGEFGARRFAQLFFVAVQAVSWRDGAVEAVVLVIDADAKVQRIHQAGSCILAYGIATATTPEDKTTAGD